MKRARPQTKINTNRQTDKQTSARPRRDETRRDETKRNETKRDETKRNETKQNKRWTQTRGATADCRKETTYFVFGVEQTGLFSIIYSCQVEKRREITIHKQGPFHQGPILHRTDPPPISNTHQTHQLNDPPDVDCQTRPNRKQHIPVLGKSILHCPLSLALHYTALA